MTTSGVNVQVSANTAQASASFQNISKQIDKIANSSSGLQSVAAKIITYKAAWDVVSGAVGKVIDVSRALINEYAF